MKPKNYLLASIFLIVAIIACNMPAPFVEIPEAKPQESSYTGFDPQGFEVASEFDAVLAIGFDQHGNGSTATLEINSVAKVDENHQVVLPTSLTLELSDCGENVSLSLTPGVTLPLIPADLLKCKIETISADGWIISERANTPGVWDMKQNE